MVWEWEVVEKEKYIYGFCCLCWVSKRHEVLFKRKIVRSWRKCRRFQFLGQLEQGNHHSYAVLGGIPKISGTADVLGSIAYVSQTSWIQRGASPISQDSPGLSTNTGSMQLLLIRTMTVSCWIHVLPARLLQYFTLHLVNHPHQQSNHFSTSSFWHPTFDNQCKWFHAWLPLMCHFFKASTSHSLMLHECTLKILLLKHQFSKIQFSNDFKSFFIHL